jgi:MoxR-like ATPase
LSNLWLQSEHELPWSNNAANGLSTWKTVLQKGRLPIPDDFSKHKDKDSKVWPEEPLFSAISNVMADLQLPRFVLSHPETVTAVLLSVWRLVMNFQNEVIKASSLQQDEQEPINDDDNYETIQQPQASPIDDTIQEQPLDETAPQLIAEQVASSLIQQFGGVIGGMHALGQLFPGATSSSLADVCFGLQDGIWQHTGWVVLPELQRQLASMVELKELLKTLGRRPTAQGSTGTHHFAPRKLSPVGGLGAQYDSSQKTSVQGLTLSNSLSEMLPSEAVLLTGKLPALRRFFFAKKVESKLMSYDISGWTDVPSEPRPKPRYLPRMPSAPGGPIIVCLDTSWSMSGQRERLAKSVVLACVSAAHKQGRDCHVVAFSNENGVMQVDKLTRDKEGIQRLLEFLSHSFGGGTDVTGALKHVMNMTNINDNVAVAAADLLLVTDGEIPDPPVSEQVMEDLDRLRRRTGLQAHGLLVGKSESKPLTRLCTQTHDFLLKYDMLLTTGGSGADVETARGTPAMSRREKRVRFSSTSLSATARWRSDYGNCLSTVGRRKLGTTTSLYAKYGAADEDWGNTQGKTRNEGNKRRRLEEDDELWEEHSYSMQGTEDDEMDDMRYDGKTLEPTPDTESSFNLRLEEAVETLVSSVATTLQNQEWKASELDAEKERSASCWPYRSELKAAVDRIADNLVEREEEARLVVLGMISREHVLFLGPPGTGKSALGRRLSTLCGGQFFQRLLTRFTTPEEIFGPLSLRALENDEYRRCTTGFLPTASVAFLDEIFKANSAILNTLLTILNERQYDNGSGLREECPIRCVVGASNELPESDELDALYDRFLLRKEVLPVSDEGLMLMLAMPTPGESPCDDRDDGVAETKKCDVVFKDGLDQVVEALSTAANSVLMGTDACALLRDLRNFMREELGVEVSDRRLVKATRLLKISAASHGRISVDPLDCLLLQHLAWRLPEQRAAVREWLWDHLTPGCGGGGGATGEEDSPSAATAQFRFVLDGLRREATEAVRKTAGDVLGSSGARAADVAFIESLRTEAANLASILRQRSTALARHMELLQRSMDHLWLDPDEARAAQQILFPKAEAFSLEVDRALADACALELALGDSSSSPSNDLRVSVLELLWDEGAPERTFTSEEMNMGMREAKSIYDLDTFRMWKRARKKAK